MSDDKPGDPGSVRHLRPTAMPIAPHVMVSEPTDDDDDYDPDFMEHTYEQLLKLREPFAPDKIEKLPKPMWKDAWKDKRASNCHICHGYHVLDNSIHLDYVGHASVTNRLLEVDPLWTWEPLAYTPEGTPRFSDGGLWIKLTVCGVTRIGFGDGKSVKEVIGDAIRNAAMRFGVALDLWSKIDLHTERNPGDGETSQTKRRDSGAGVHASERDGGDGGQRRGRQGGPAADSQEGSAPRAPNQDALDALQSVCDEYGYSTQYCIDRWADDHDGQHITQADADGITAFAGLLIVEATPEPDDSGAGSAVLGDEAGATADDRHDPEPADSQQDMF